MSCSATWSRIGIDLWSKGVIARVTFSVKLTFLLLSIDSAVVGVAIGFESGRVVYSTRQMVEVLVQEEKFTEEEAWEYLEFNTFGAYVGKETPIYIDTL